MNVQGIQWDSLLAKRAAAIRPSVFIDFANLPPHPDIIRFAGGAPPPEAVPLDRLRQAMAQAWEIEPETLYYGETEGHEPLRRLIAERMGRRGATVDPDNVLITNGSQQGLDLVAKLFIEPGDRVIIEGPTYFGALQVFDVYEAQYLTVPMDDAGMIPSALEEALASYPTPKLIYTIPTFQNPMGVSINPERRRQVVDLARAYNVPIVEDDPYGELWFRGADPGPLRALDQEVIYLGTFSKTLAPALRMGWMAAPHPLMKLLIDAKEGVDIQSDRVVQRGIVAAAECGWLDAHLTRVRNVYRERCDLMLACLEREMPRGTHWTVPDGGFFIWVTLPDGANSDALLADCVANGAAYIPGSAFYADGHPTGAFRLGFTTLPPDRITEGIARLGQALRARLG